LGETVKAELHLRYSAYLAQNERVEEAWVFFDLSSIDLCEGLMQSGPRSIARQ
jgi:hypothetical protein